MTESYSARHILYSQKTGSQSVAISTYADVNEEGIKVGQDKEDSEDVQLGRLLSR
jgi:hypothetical protein